jgi:hypothetical protein
VSTHLPSARLSPLAAALPVVLVALPVAVLVVPNTMQYMIAQGLGLGGGHDGPLIRAAGLALPALLCAVPVGAVAARKAPAWLVLTIGLTGVLGGVLAVEAADGVLLAGTARLVQGAGAGLILPATLALAWERRHRTATAVWAGVLTASLLIAMPVALHGVPAAPTDTEGSWRVVLQPSPRLIGLALAVTAAGAVVLARAGSGLPALRRTERTQLLLPVVPAGGFAALGIMTTYGWSPGAQLLVAGTALAALLGLALVGSRDASTGSPHGCAIVMLAAGLLAFPVVAPLSGLFSGATSPAAVPLAPFASAGAAALLGALLAMPLCKRSNSAVRGAIMAGHGLVLVAVLACLAVDANSRPALLHGPLVPLGAGLGLALSASLHGASAGAGLFGLSLCFPALLTGQLAVSALQHAQIRRFGEITSNAELLSVLTHGYRIWLLAAGVLTVLLAGSLLLAVRRGGHGFPPAAPTGSRESAGAR